MPKRVTNKRRIYKYSIGDMRERVSFFDRVLIPGSFSATPEESYINESKKWASIESIGQRHYFNDVNIDTSPSTHKFIIRYDSSITSEKRIKYNSEIYSIEKIEIPENRREFMVIFAYIQGNEDKEANQ